MLNSIIEADMEMITGTDLPWSNLKNKTVVISGANGMLPAYMVETLLYLNDKQRLGVTVIGLVRNKEKAFKRFEHYQRRNDLKLIVQDVTQAFTIKEKVDCIIHAASQASPKYYGVDPVGTLLANVLGTYYLLELGKLNEIENFFYFSSGEVYGEITEKNIPTSETMYAYFDHLNPRASYGESKKMGETMCVAYAHQFGFPVKIVRPYHVYGPGVDLEDSRSFADFISDVVNNRDITLFSSGSTVRSFCYLADATIGFFSVLLKGKSSEAYNIGNPTISLSILQLAECLINLFPEKNLKIIRKKRLKSDTYIQSTIKISSPDVAKAFNLGWRPTVSIEEGLKKTVRSFYGFNGMPKSI
jgi:UDP-glucuronate decarboxylase